MLEFSKSMLLSSIASIIFQITYKTQNLVKCQGTLSIKTQSIRKIYQTKHLSPHFNNQNSTSFDYEGPNNPHFQIFYNHHLMPFLNHSSIATPYNFQNLLIIH